MDRNEITKLFRLLRELYPNNSRYSSETTMQAWELVLEPFDYADIKAAAVAFAREKTFPPDPGDLCRGLISSSPSPALPHEETAGEAWQRRIDDGYCRDAADELGSVSRYAREHGISWHEAKEALSNATT